MSPSHVPQYAKVTLPLHRPASTQAVHSVTVRATTRLLHCIYSYSGLLHSPQGTSENTTSRQVFPGAVATCLHFTYVERGGSMSFENKEAAGSWLRLMGSPTSPARRPSRDVLRLSSSGLRDCIFVVSNPDSDNQSTNCCHLHLTFRTQNPENLRGLQWYKRSRYDLQERCTTQVTDHSCSWRIHLSR